MANMIPNQMGTSNMRDRALLEIMALRRVFRFTKKNSHLEKLLVWVFLFVWGIITIGISFGWADATMVYNALTALVWALVGRVWGTEVKDMTSGGAG